MKTTDREQMPFNVGVLSVVKHDYLPRAIAAHPRFNLSFVTDEISRPQWTHERNQKFADEFEIPYIKDIDKALSENKIDAVAVSPEAERHCDLAVIAAEAGLHIVIDKPLSTKLTECDRLIDAIERNKVTCLVWNRNYLPSLIQANNKIQSKEIGKLLSLHCDFYFSKDAGPPIGSSKPNDPPINWLDRQLEAHADGSDGGVGQKRWENSKLRVFILWHTYKCSLGAPKLKGFLLEPSLIFTKHTMTMMLMIWQR
ncbi:MAG: Gfo/Idh/MocA family oxidoreductase [Verrucomicrobiota bacterium]|nr:Gfo/Idh/MocA family oxidoreductase [Verrucomicrobiota bacterium]